MKYVKIVFDTGGSMGKWTLLNGYSVETIEKGIRTFPKSRSIIFQIKDSK
jgi:hypothetical protein